MGKASLGWGSAMKPGDTKEVNGWVYRYEGAVQKKVIVGYEKVYKKVNGVWQYIDVPIYEERIFYRYYRYRRSAIGCYRSPINFQCSTVTGGTSYTFHDCTPP